MSLKYIIPPRPFRYPVPEPGPVPGTKREWVPCIICTTLFLRRTERRRGLGRPVNPRTTCGAAICVAERRKKNRAAFLAANPGWTRRANNRSSVRYKRLAVQNHATPRPPCSPEWAAVRARADARAYHRRTDKWRRRFGLL